MTPQKLMVIFVDETDISGEVPLYEAITRKLIQLEAPGATVQAGIMGYGRQHMIHRKRLFGISDDRPVTISVIAPEALLREKILPVVRPMVSDGLVILLDVEVVPGEVIQ